MASASTTTTFAAYLKELYDGDAPVNIAEKGHPLFSMLRKKGGFTGDTLRVPLYYGNPTGRSHTFSTAQSNASSSKTAKFDVEINANYGVITVDALAMAKSKDDKGAFAELKKTEIDGIIAELGDSIARELYGSGSGSIARVLSISTDTITLYEPTDTRHFVKDMVVQMDTADGGGTVHSGTLTVASVNRSAGTVTFTANVTTGISSAAADDYVFPAGDYDGAMKGLASYIPLTAPTGGDNLWGLDRSVDTDRLAGVRVTEPNAPKTESLIKAAEGVKSFKGKSSHAFCNHEVWSEVEFELGDRAVRDEGLEAEVGFPSIKLYSSGGAFNLFADSDCPYDRGYVLQLDTWVIRHLNAFPHVVDDDGLVEIRQSSDDGIEARVRAWGQLVTNAPGRNAVVQFPSTN